MEQDATLRVVYNFRDRDNRKGSTSIRLPFSVTIATALSYAISFSIPLSNMSDAVLVSIDIFYGFEDTDAVTPLSGATVDTKVSLFYSEGDIYEAITIPAPKGEIFETEGQYQGIRVDVNSVDMVAWMDNWTDVSSNLQTPEGLPFPINWRAGGLIL